jgi:serine/threonine-protein phosphatase PGAM5
MSELEPGEAQVCEEQLELAFSQFFAPTPDGDRDDILVCHGNVIRYLVTRVLRVDTHAWLGLAVGNCSLTVIRIGADGAMKVLMVGDVGHIPVNLQTGLYFPIRELEIPPP